MEDRKSKKTINITFCLTCLMKKIKTMKDIMTPNPITIKLPADRAEFLRLIGKTGRTGMPVVDGEGKFLGMVTRRDILEKPSESQISLIMRSKEVAPWTYEDTTVEEGAGILLKHGRRHMAILDHSERVVGIVTPYDFMKVVKERKISSPVINYVRSTCIPVYSKTPLKVLFRLIMITKMNAFPVLDENAKLVGIITDRDLFSKSYIDTSLSESDIGISEFEDEWTWEGLRSVMKLVYMVSDLKIPEMNVEDVMVSNPISVFEKTPAYEAASIMLKNHFSQLPIRNLNDELVAMIYDFDLVKSIIE